jgi:hypothetical protein
MDLKELKEKIGQYNRLFATKDGQAVLSDLEKRCFIHSTTYDDNHGKMGFNEGRRSVFVYIANMKDKRVEDIEIQREYKPKGDENGK